MSEFAGRDKRITGNLDFVIRVSGENKNFQESKVLVPSDEKIKRVNAARFQLDIMEVPGIIVSRTDAEAATLLDGNGDERDQPFILGTTKLDIPSYKYTYLTILKRINEKGVKEINGHTLYKISDETYAETDEWLEETGIASIINKNVERMKGDSLDLETAFDSIVTKFVQTWEEESGLSTFGETKEKLIRLTVWPQKSSRRRFRKTACSPWPAYRED